MKVPAGLRAHPRAPAITHYELTTGETRPLFRSDVHHDRIHDVRPMLEPAAMPGHAVPQFDDYFVTSISTAGGCVFTVLHQQRPLLTAGLATDERSAKALWPVLEAIYLRVTEETILRTADHEPPHHPGPPPWLTTATLFAQPIEYPLLDELMTALAWARMDE